MKYAQIDLETGVVIAITYPAGPLEGDHMILLDDADDVQPGDILNPDGSWTRPEPPPMPEPTPSLQEQLATLQAGNEALRNADLDNKEAIATLYEMLLMGV